MKCLFFHLNNHRRLSSTPNLLQLRSPLSPPPPVPPSSPAPVASPADLPLIFQPHFPSSLSIHTTTPSPFWNQSAGSSAISRPPPPPVPPSPPEAKPSRSLINNTAHGCEVRAGERFEADIAEGMILLILKVYLGVPKENIHEDSVSLHITIDGKKLVAGNFNLRRHSEQELYLSIDKKNLINPRPRTAYQIVSYQIGYESIPNVTWIANRYDEASLIGIDKQTKEKTVNVEINAGGIEHEMITLNTRSKPQAVL
ncbi:unnamed protein product [Lactuca virosa]|uniref:Uncharacterized protein n=1 Tax=Lactuca virosa TaxID=75947 RepID=A0AAU9PAV7_9ASTR|nr:unnamed protein product [Lactuca virosa]